jgi:hypothetical protein
MVHSADIGTCKSLVNHAFCRHILAFGAALIAAEAYYLLIYHSGMAAIVRFSNKSNPDR